MHHEEKEGDRKHIIKGKPESSMGGQGFDKKRGSKAQKKIR